MEVMVQLVLRHLGLFDLSRRFIDIGGERSHDSTSRSRNAPFQGANDDCEGVGVRKVSFNVAAASRGTRAESIPRKRFRQSKNFSGSE